MQSKAKRTNSTRKKVLRLLHAVVVIVALLPIAAGVLVLCYQVIFWLKVGQWYPCPLGLLVYRLVPVASWCEICGSWVGLQKIVLAILDGVPLSVALVVAGASLLVADS